ncbi:uncharacterized protein LOC130714497 isoform X2 [Lotus japonicus]|uniref:uncharacterized protein LOC130714497 isoform X2 n=1 Tax=Lotus japonicus TaxID=34305 RepID=UPI002589F5D2|nr:uncharacterized protein LOC130714497 isoform X2 [Lotus japonicus]
MPTKQVVYRRDRAVLLRVYVEKPRKKKPPPIQHQHHHHHHYHIHHTVRKEEIHGSGSKGSYDRRSGLLKYSRLLRESARGASSTPLPSKGSTTKNLQPPTLMAPFKKKQPKYAERPACFGDWKLLIPSCLRQMLSAPKKGQKKKKMHGGFSGNLMKKLQVRRGKSFIPNVFSTTRKRA